MRTFEPIKVNPCSAKTYGSCFFHNQGDGVLGSFTLFLRVLVVYNQGDGDGDATLHLRLLIQYSKGDGVIFSLV